MRAILYSVTASIWAGFGFAQSADIESVITRQLDAFQADDFATAFTFAAPGIQSILGTAQRFGMMVRNGYPMVYRPADVDFQDLRGQGRTLFQDVLIEDQNGQFFIAEYEMVLIDGAWRIGGVTLKRAPILGA